MVVNPIWKDTEYYTTASAMTYSIEVNGVTIFNGRAFKKPDADYLSININKICQNYLDNDLPDSFAYVDTSTVFTNDEAVNDFVLKSRGATLETYRFNYDWSYDTGNPSPINDHYATGQLYMSTSRGSSSYATTVSPIASGAYCGDYAMYYLDSYGCWQSFLFEGNCKMNDTYHQYEYNKSFNNNTVQFEQGRYISEIQTNYELSTGWLNDEQSYNFARNLVGTNVAYLHNLKNGKIFPVIIDEQSVEYKQYKTQKHLIEYTIMVKESQNRIRK